MKKSLTSRETMEKRKVQKVEKEPVTRIPSGSPHVKRWRKKPVKRLLEVNTKIKSRTKRSWSVVAHIGSGGFGDVYKVVDENKPSFECAMKTEIHGAQQRRLNIEKNILNEIDDYTREHKKTRHFCELIDSGQTVEYSWIVMTLIGPSLDIVRRMLNKQFTKTCVIGMALQILDAVEVMHEVGFIHRDLKPGNICTGVPPNDDNILYVLDFGISRRIFRNMKSRELRKKRERVPFYGTRKFCSRACHLEKDQGRKDDMETYVYTILDLLHNEKGLPWSKDLKQPAVIVEKKKALFVNPTKELDPMVPVAFANIITYLGPLKFEDPLDYKLIEGEIRSIRKNNTRTSEPSDESMDWTGKLEMLLVESRKTPKKMEVPKGEETMMLERMQKARMKGREMGSYNKAALNDTTRTMTREGDGSEGPPDGTTNLRMTTQNTAGLYDGLPPLPRSKKREKEGKPLKISRT